MIDWDSLVLGPVMAIFGEGDDENEDQLPLYTPVDGIPFYLRDAVFDEAYSHVVVTDDGEATAVSPALGVRAALFEVPPRQRDVVLISRTGKTYVVKDVQPDGHGHIKLLLNEVAT